MMDIDNKSTKTIDHHLQLLTEKYLLDFLENKEVMGIPRLSTYSKETPISWRNKLKKIARTSNTLKFLFNDDEAIDEWTSIMQ